MLLRSATAEADEGEVYSPFNLVRSGLLCHGGGDLPAFAFGPDFDARALLDEVVGPDVVARPIEAVDFVVDADSR